MNNTYDCFPSAHFSVVAMPVVAISLETLSSLRLRLHGIVHYISLYTFCDVIDRRTGCYGNLNVAIDSKRKKMKNGIYFKIYQTLNAL